MTNQTTLGIGMPDPEIFDIGKRLMFDGVKHAPSRVKLDFIEAVMQSLGPNEFYLLIDQAPNDVIVDFIIDTMEFIDGAPRQMSIETWFTLLDRKPVQRRKNVKKVPRMSKNYIGKWLRRPNGFQDLVFTFMVLFGTNLPDHRVYDGLNKQTIFI